MIQAENNINFTLEKKQYKNQNGARFASGEQIVFINIIMYNTEHKWTSVHQ